MANEPYSPSPIGNPSFLARRNWFQTMLVKFIGKHTPKCNQMVQILSKSMDEPMPLSMRIKKRFHFLICCWCQRYEEQLHYLRDVAHAFPEHADVASPHAVTGEARERWKNALRTASVEEQTTEVRLPVREPKKRSGGHSSSGSSSGMTPWPILIGATAFAIVLVALTVNRFNPARPAISLGDFREEMVSFAKIEPNLEMRSNQLSQLREWITKSGAPSQFAIPVRMESLEPVGCRILRFRGHDVTLVCFRRDNGALLHLFVMDRAGMPGMPKRERPIFSNEGEWMTGTWAEGDHVYMVAVQGDEKTLAGLLDRA